MTLAHPLPPLSEQVVQNPKIEVSIETRRPGRRIVPVFRPYGFQVRYVLVAVRIPVPSSESNDLVLLVHVYYFNESRSRVVLHQLFLLLTRPFRSFPKTLDLIEVRFVEVPANTCCCGGEVAGIWAIEGLCGGEVGWSRGLDFELHFSRKSYSCLGSQSCER